MNDSTVYITTKFDTIDHNRPEVVVGLPNTLIFAMLRQYKDRYEQQHRYARLSIAESD